MSEGENKGAVTAMEFDRVNAWHEDDFHGEDTDR